MLPKQNDPFWIQNGTLPVRLEKMPLQIYAVHQGEVTIFLSLEEIDDLIRLVYGDEITQQARPRREALLSEDSWLEAQQQEPD